MDRRHARAPTGDRAHCARPFHRGEQINLIGAVSYDGMVCTMSVDGTVNGEVFLAFVDHFLGPKLRAGDVVIMDHLPAHKMVTVERAIERHGAQVLFLPPYSPDFNPIELLWSKLKEIIRSFAPKTVRAFYRALKNALEAITPGDIHNWFAHCCLGQRA